MVRSKRWRGQAMPSVPEGAGFKMKRIGDHWALYVLRDPVTNCIRYVGATGCPAMRLGQHISSAKCSTSRTPLRQWISGLLADQMLPLIQFVRHDTIRRYSWHPPIRYELELMEYLSRRGCLLTNRRDRHHLARLNHGKPVKRLRYISKDIVEKLGDIK